MKNAKKPKKRIKRRTLFTLLSMFNLTWYTIVVLYASFTDHAVQSELTIAWFAAWTTELALLYGIKVHDKYTSEDNSSEEECIDDAESCDCDESIEEDDARQCDSFNEVSDIDD